MQLVEFTNSLDPDEVAHNEPPHLDLHCVCPLVFLDEAFFFKFCRSFFFGHFKG